MLRGKNDFVLELVVLDGKIRDKLIWIQKVILKGSPEKGVLYMVKLGLD